MEKLVRTCDGCGRELMHQRREIHVSVRWPNGMDVPRGRLAYKPCAPLDLDFCDYKCVLEYFGTHDDQPKA